MKLLTPVIPDPRAPLARAHPLPKLAAAAVLMLALFVTVDPLTPAIVLAGLVVALPLTGAGGPLLRRVWPLLVASIGLALFTAVFATGRGGETLLEIGPLRVTTGSALSGLAVALRVMGIALSGAIALATIEPVDLADALIQHLRAPPRFVVGAIAAYRLVPIFASEWEILGLARRARGVEADRTLADRLRAFPGRTYGLLVAAIRRATRLALAMDARGFAASPCRTLARPRAIGRPDWAVLGLAIALGMGATVTSLVAGTWRPLLTF